MNAAEFIASLTGRSGPLNVTQAIAAATVPLRPHFHLFGKEATIHIHAGRVQVVGDQRALEFRIPFDTPPITADLRFAIIPARSAALHEAGTLILETAGDALEGFPTKPRPFPDVGFLPAVKMKRERVVVACPRQGIMPDGQVKRFDIAPFLSVTNGEPLWANVKGGRLFVKNADATYITP